jgi:hypothetical protein
MPENLEFGDDFPRLEPDPPRAYMQFSVRWRVTNTGDETSEAVGVRIDLLDANGPLITSIGRDVVPLEPGESDEDVVGVGAVGSGSIEVAVCGLLAVIPVTIT